MATNQPMIEVQDLHKDYGTVRAVDGISKLRYAPRVTNKVISNALAPRMERLSIPTFVFADPCGYKGLSLRLITAALKGFGNYCLFFFNYNRVNMKLGYPVMDESIDELFEHDRAAALRAEVGALAPSAREKRVLGAIEEALRQAGALPPGLRVSDTGGRRHEPSPCVRIERPKRRDDHEAPHE